MNKILVEKFQEVDFNGASETADKKIYSYGILPGERAKVKIVGKKNKKHKAEVIKIIEKSPLRIKPRENHYLSCSPWQVFDYSLQIDLKKKLFKKSFKEFSHEEIKINKFFQAKKLFGYRTKIEYSFLEENEKLFFSFYKRGSFKKKIKLKNGCSLIDKKSNDIAFRVLDFLNKKKIKNLKSLIIRKSYFFNDHHLSLLTKEEKIPLNLESFISSLNISGFILAYSNPKSPASNFDKILFSYGKEFIREKILDLKFKYHYQSFFQNNLELFPKILKKIKNFFSSKKLKKILDLYCGIGVISLSLCNLALEIIGVDSNENSIKYALENAHLNGIKNFKGIISKSEELKEDIFENIDLLIIDPPRSGLHQKVIELILDKKPKYICYLSCNPLTQARDYRFLKEKYSLEKVYGFDFYPNTPHLETLIILKLK